MFLPAPHLQVTVAEWLARLTAVRQGEGSNRTEGGCVFVESDLVLHDLLDNVEHATRRREDEASMVVIS